MLRGAEHYATGCFGCHGGMMVPVAQGLSGGEIAERGIPGRKVASCLDCHGVEGRAKYPRLTAEERRDVAAYFAALPLIEARRWE